MRNGSRRVFLLRSPTSRQIRMHVHCTVGSCIALLSFACPLEKSLHQPHVSSSCQQCANSLRTYLDSPDWLAGFTVDANCAENVRRSLDLQRRSSRVVSFRTEEKSCCSTSTVLVQYAVLYCMRPRCVFVRPRAETHPPACSRHRTTKVDNVTYSALPRAVRVHTWHSIATVAMHLRDTFLEMS